MHLRALVAILLFAMGTLASGDRARVLSPVMWTVTEQADDLGNVAFTQGRFIVKSSRGFTLVDAATGRAAWNDTQAAGTMGTWAVASGTLVGSFSVPTTGDSMDFVAGFDLSSGRMLWRHDRMSPAGDWHSKIVTTVVVWDHAHHRLTGLDPASGATLWTSAECRRDSCTFGQSVATAAVVVLATRDGGTSTVLFLDPPTGHVRARRVERTQEYSLIRSSNDVVSVVHGQTITLYDSYGNRIAERRGCWSGCSFAVTRDLLVLAYSTPQAVVEGVDRLSGASKWRRDDFPFGTHVVGGSCGARVVTSVAPLRFSEMDVADGRTLRSFSLPVDSDLNGGCSDGLYAAAGARPGGTGQVMLSRLVDDLTLYLSRPSDVNLDACALPLPPEFHVRVTPADRMTTGVCTFAERRNALLQVSLNLSAHASDLFHWQSARTAGVALEQVGDEAFADGDPPHAINMRVGRMLVQLATGDERLRARLDQLASTLADNLANGLKQDVAPPVQAPPLSGHVASTPLFVSDHGQPNRLWSITMGNATYIRREDSSLFAKQRPGTVSFDGKWSASIATTFPARGHHDIVRITDLATGALQKLATVPGPLGVVDPSWSPDSRRLLLTVEHPDSRTVEGYVIIDPAMARAHIHLLATGQRVIGRYVWKDNDTLLASYIDHKGSRAVLTAFDMAGGHVQQTHISARPVSESKTPVSPSGNLLAAKCRGRPSEVCVVDLRNSEIIAHVRLDPKDLIGWYDDAHLVAWAGAETGTWAYVVTFAGTYLHPLFMIADPDTDGPDLDATLFPIPPTAGG